MIALIAAVFLIILLLIGMPVGFSLLTVGTVGIFIDRNLNTLEGILSTAVYSSINSYTLTTIPLFILMAFFVSKSNIAEDMFTMALRWLGGIRGGVGASTVLASAGFSALSGSSSAATAVMAKICVPQLERANYKVHFSSGIVAVSGGLAIMIPPSIPLILYGVQTETSIGQLLIAALIPGILIAAGLCLMIILFVPRYTHGEIKAEKVTWKEKFQSLKYPLPMLVIILVVILSMYLGLATATEAAAVGAVTTLLAGIIMKRLSFKDIVEASLNSLRLTTMIFTIIIGAHVFTYFITMTGIGQDLITFVENSGMSTWMVLTLIIIIYIILGMFLDTTGSLLLTLPLVFPLITSLGFDPIWFGVLVVLLLEIGLITPPNGINAFIVSKSAGVPAEKVFLGVIPGLFVLLLFIVIFIIFPDIITFLPNSGFAD